MSSKKKDKKQEKALTPTQHEVDFELVTTVEDIVLILDCMNFIICDNDENFKKVKHLLKD